MFLNQGLLLSILQVQFPDYTFNNVRFQCRTFTRISIFYSVVLVVEWKTWILRPEYHHSSTLQFKCVWQIISFSWCWSIKAPTAPFYWILVGLLLIGCIVQQNWKVHLLMYWYHTYLDKKVELGRILIRSDRESKDTLFSFVVYLL